MFARIARVESDKEIQFRRARAGRTSRNGGRRWIPINSK
jgi:hypothetical protein